MSSSYGDFLLHLCGGGKHSGKQLSQCLISDVLSQSNLNSNLSKYPVSQTLIEYDWQYNPF